MSACEVRIRKMLLAWYYQEKRILPWRGTRDPYRIWVSEVMLQQTTVATVIRRYGDFLARFPDLPTLAAAPESRVLAAWSGLGYYARARHLHRAAREIVRRHGGRFPRTARNLEALPGFGPYMAAAVASLAFGERIAAADANVARVISRLFALGSSSGTSAHRRDVLRRAAALLPRGRPGDFTAALMDLGQTVCTARDPRCRACPLSADCAAGRAGEATRYPWRGPRPAVRRAHVAAACAIAEGRVLLVQRPETLLRGMWQFPLAEGKTQAAARENLRRVLSDLGLRLAPRGRAVVTRHTMVHRRLEIAVYRAIAVGGPVPATRRPAPARWFAPRQLRAAAVPTLTRKIAAAGGFPFPRQRRILHSSAPPVAPGRLRARGSPARGPGADAPEGRDRLRSPGAASHDGRPRRVHDPLG